MLGRRGLKLCIITPEEVFFDGDCDMLILRAQDGELGILPGHAPLITILAHGNAVIIDGNIRRKAFVSGGFAEILPEGATVVTDSAVWLS